MAALIQAYWLDLDKTAVDLGACRDALEPAEQARAARFRFPRDRRRYIARHGMLRFLLAERLGAKPASLRFATGAYGKPALAAGALRFNMSHSQELALFVLADEIEVGCDIERRDEAFAEANIPERFFSAAEIAALTALPPERRSEGFFNAWTRKEAYIKALGMGLARPLDSFDVGLAPGEAPALRRGGEGWTLAAFAPVPLYHAAVAAPGDWRLTVEEWAAAACGGTAPRPAAA